MVRATCSRVSAPFFDPSRLFGAVCVTRQSPSVTHKQNDTPEESAGASCPLSAMGEGIKVTSLRVQHLGGVDLGGSEVQSHLPLPPKVTEN